MKIAAYTIGDINRASSRLRSYYLFSTAKKFNLEVLRPSRFRDAFDADVVHIQKRLNERIILAVIVYRILGIKVVFDIDDQPGSLKSFLAYLLVLSLCNVVTVDTEARKQYWQRFIFFKNIVVVNDIADSNFSNLVILDRTTEKKYINYFWLGHSSNLSSIKNFIKFIKISPQSKLIISIEKDAIEHWRVKYPFINFIPWFNDIAFDPSLNARFMVLNHLHDKASILKSDNKMVLALLAGFIPIVSRTPAYEKLAKLLDAEFLIFDNVKDIPDIAKKTSNLDSQDFFTKALNLINEHYSRDAVLSSFIKNVLST